MDYNELESALNKVLPEGSAKGKIDLKRIAELTDLLISEREWTETRLYTHSVCHLFERYGNSGKWSQSYLNSAELLGFAEKLVAATLEKAVKSDEFLNVKRIITPIIDYNLDHMAETQGSFAFKPAVLKDPAFIAALGESEEAEYGRTCLDFCKAETIEDFFKLYVEELKREEKIEAGGSQDTETMPGIYVDVDGTLHHGKDYETGEPAGITEIAQEYVLKKIEEGVSVTVFTGGSPEEAAKRLEEAGADKRLLKVESKKGYIGKTLEVLVDDTPPERQGFRARTHYASGQQAMDAEYQKPK